MKIALIGATGNIGSAIAQEALRRKHAVTGITRRTSGLPPTLTGIEVRSADVLDHAALTAAVEGHDVLASAFGPGADAALIVDATRAIVAAARAVGIKRVIVVGGAGSLEIGGGKQLVDSPNFPAAYRSYALAHREALAVLRDAADLNWTFFAPAAEIGPGDKVGKFRVSVRSLIADEAGRSAISYADYAAAFVSEIEAGSHPKEVVTVAY